VIERDVLEPRRTVRMCTTTDTETSKCQDLAQAAYSRDIRPGLSCVSRPSLDECLSAIKDNQADVVSVDAGLAVSALKKFQVAPVLKEEYEDDHRTSAVAVVKKSSALQSWADLKGHKACFSNLGEAAGWVVPVHKLVTSGLVDKNNCPYTKAMAEFFAAVNYSEEPFKCLASGEGDVAFLDYDSVMRHIDAGEQAAAQKGEDYELLCEDGGRKPLDQYAACRLATVPPKVVLSRKDMAPVEKDDILFALLSSADLYHKHPDYFDMFGSYKGHPNLLFSNSASGLDAVHPGADPLAAHQKLHDDLKTCTPQESKP